MATQRETAGAYVGGGVAAAGGAAGWLHLAAAPTFAVMALLTQMLGGPADMLCAGGDGALSLTGMVPMYALMSAFHAAPWLRLISGRSGSRPRKRLSES